ncbi:hypothetical protein PZA11_006256 [Diplocarpon coronariae]
MFGSSPDSSGAGSSCPPAVTLVIKACDMCRKKKIKCEPTGQTCLQCIKYRTHCHFTPISTKRAARKPAGHKRVEELEKRLKSMEESLKRATEKLQQSPAEREAERQQLAARESRHPVDEGRSPPSFTDHGGAASLVTDLDPRAAAPAWNLTPLTDIFARRVFRSLPPRAEAVEQIRLTHAAFSCVFPLFQVDFFVAKLDDLDNSIKDPAFWACYNIVLALAHRFYAVVESRRAPADDQAAWGYFRNALGVVNELILMPPSLMAVRALLGLAIIVQGTANPAPYAFLNAAAMNMAQRLGLHRKSHDPSRSAAEDEQRKRVFWVAYFLDKDASMRTIRQPIQADDDMDVDLPDFGPAGSPHAGSLHFFQLRIGLAMIQGKIYARLLSVRAHHQSVVERVGAAKDLTRELESWKQAVPAEYLHDYRHPPPSMAGLTTSVHAVILRLTYFHSLNVIHRFATPVSRWQEMLETPPLYASDAPVYDPPPPPITCIDEARKALKLLLMTPQGDYACVWVVLHIFVSAATVLLAHIRADPLTLSAPSDLQLIEPLLSLLGLLSMQGKSATVAAMYEDCRAAWEHARRLAWEARGASLPPGAAGSSVMTIPHVPENVIRHPAMMNGRMGEEKESLEDFIRRIEGIAGGDDNTFDFDFV